MLDPKQLRNQLNAVKQGLQQRGIALDTRVYQDLEAQRKQTQVQLESLQAEAKKISKEISQQKQQAEQMPELFEQANRVKAKIDSAKKQYDAIQTQMKDYCLDLPNLPSESTPPGCDENDNVEVRIWGEKPDFTFKPRDHVDLGVKLGLLDAAAASKLSGARFIVFYTELAELHRALIRWMLDMHVDAHGYREAYVPYLVSAESLIGTGQLPKFSEELFHIEGADLHLIPTAEVSLTNLYRNQIVPEERLPIRLVAHTPCFRSEAGSYGKDTRGILRQHQFEKVELVQLVAPGHSFEALEEITGHAEAILQGLDLHYRVVNLCAGDLGFASAKTYDLELWSPGQEQYIEVSSCSNMTDFQARRIQARMRCANDSKIELLHTLNGSGLAVGRTLLAVLENYQEEDGSIRIPSVLIPYMKGKTRIICPVP